MQIVFHKNFEKKYLKLSQPLKLKVKKAIVLFEQDHYNIVLKNHALSGKYTGYRSINVAGDVRIIYKLLYNNAVLFSEIGSHSALYK